jgi:hypothetical protein
VLYAFCSVAGCADGVEPNAGVTLDPGGNIFGTTTLGGLGHCANTGTCGTVFELSPADDGWKFTSVYEFCQLSNCLDGALPDGGITLDGAGNLYGTASSGGAHGQGVAFTLQSGIGGWGYAVIHAFCSTHSKTLNCTDGATPASSLTFDTAGNLYGATTSGANGAGVVFKLAPLGGNEWKETSLYHFCKETGCADGNGPSSPLMLESTGELYGLTGGGGTGNSLGGAGTVYTLGD